MSSVGSKKFNRRRKYGSKLMSLIEFIVMYRLPFDKAYSGREVLRFSVSTTIRKPLRNMKFKRNFF